MTFYTRITGLIKNSAGVELSGKLKITLDFPITDRNTIPHSTYATETEIFEVIDGVVDIELKETQTLKSTYRFEFYLVSEIENFYTEEGANYLGPTHLHEGNYYTGNFHTDSSTLLFRQLSEQERSIIDFHAQIPPVSEIYFSDLLPTGISSNVLDTSIARLAQELATNPKLLERIASGVTNASNIDSTPVGQVEAVTVQGAIEELDSEKLAIASNLSDLANTGTSRDNLGLGTAAILNSEDFAPAIHNHDGSSEVFWTTQPPGSNQLILTNAPNGISGYPTKWVVVVLDGKQYCLPAWKIK
jgi:hypothetical protein